MSLLYALLVGVAMGALIQRVGASSPRMILASLRLEDLTIIKFIATTIAVGTVVAYLLSLWMPMHFDIKPTYVIGVALGEGRRDALAALLGGVFGALVFTLVYTLIEGALIKPMNYGKITLASVLHLPPVAVAVGLAAVFLTAVTLLPTERRPATRREAGT